MLPLTALPFGSLLAPTVAILVGLVLYPFFYAIWLAFSMLFC